MTLTLTQSATAVGANASASFLGVGGSEPYSYAVLPGGTGGTIDAALGSYVAPSSVSSALDLAQLYDVIQVTDAAAATATSPILVGTPLLLFCEIIQTQLGLDPGRVVLWDQKIMLPSDRDLFVTVSVPRCKPFANFTNYESVQGGGLNSRQALAMMATLDVDIMSRGPAARDRKEEVVLAISSTYAQQQQAANGFSIGRLSTAFLNLSEMDGAAIPYRYRISFNMQYIFEKVAPAPYMSIFSNFGVVTDLQKPSLGIISGGAASTSIPDLIVAGGAAGEVNIISGGGA